jgi:hypothetical protein
MKNRLLLLLAVIAIALPAYAQKLYKIVDEEGNVSFSQFPPAEKKENVVVDDITVSGGAQSTVTEKLDGKYCGDIKLPKRYSNSSMGNYVEKLDKQRKRWRIQLDRLSQRIDASNQSAINRGSYQSRYGSTAQNTHYQQTINSHSEQVRDLRCAMSWIDKELEGNDGAAVMAESKKELERLESIRDELQAKLMAQCGELPVYDPTIRSNEAVRKRWYDCSKKLRREIDRVEKAIRKV